MTTDSSEIVEHVRSALRSEARIRLADEPLRIELTDGALLLEGEVANVGSSKLTLRCRPTDRLCQPTT